MIPDDFISFSPNPSLYDYEMHFTVPVMDADYAGRMNRLCTGMEMEVVLGGIYIQTTGPRTRRGRRSASSRKWATSWA